MGGSTYSFSSRSARAYDQGYHTKNVDQLFEQNSKRTIHVSMDPKKALLREARDSSIHPNTVPIILQLDVTGSMGVIPHNLIKEGLPKTISHMIEGGVESPALLFVAVGDHKYDSYPYQVGQFESGDAELDMWLTRTYLEGGGGGNGGESYPLGWYYAAKHTVTDAWEKRKQKGYLISIGDEPFHSDYPERAFKEIFGVGEAQSYTAEQLLKLAQEKWNVYHINLNRSVSSGWKSLLKEGLIEVEDYTKIPDVIAQLVIRGSKGVITSKLPEGEITMPDIEPVISGDIPTIDKYKMPKL